MRSIVVLSMVMLAFTACKKKVAVVIPVAGPSMLYKNLGDSNIVFGRFAAYDLDNDGAKDIYFGTQLVGDPVEQKDKKQWMVTSSFYTNLPVNIEQDIPLMPYAEAIPVQNFSGYEWFNASNALLSQKTISMVLPPYWEGKWKNADHAYIPVQVMKADGVYNGWVEVSFDITNERLILHKAAISTEVNKAVFAGK